ncbi:MAG: tRNA preQ1(34) S-adenosylmethionine ribosyltransferase-isomerase QueA, partial [Chloroflexi bacterium]|nr:tRNA preQ1(34) S-adenosylmethionine ribosyltransferase-isomerase QueA [Chloroflexota bacterium]
MRTADFNYQLPAELIAQTPATPRDAARLLVLDRGSDTVEHRRFHEIGAYLHAGDLLVVNDTRVMRARLHGTVDTGGEVEALLLRDLGNGRWEALVRPGRRLRAGRRVRFVRGDIGAEAEVEDLLPGGERVLRFDAVLNLDQVGAVPLPPYIHAAAADDERYQTVYSRDAHSAAAPTAGLHFTPELLDRLRRTGIATTTVTLHIGPGTFRPVSAEDPREHPMHEEFFRFSAEAAGAITAARARGGRIVCVGTTVVRVLEQVAELAGEGPLQAMDGWTRLLILPGHRFRLVDALITNFHLPRSTLLMLVSALAGREQIL